MPDTPTMTIASRRLLDPPVESDLLRSLAHLRRFHRDQDIYRHGERSDAWYRVVSGSARKYIIRGDGRRQLVEIYLPGDLFGLTNCVHHKFAVQAVAEGTLVACYSRRRVETLADEDPQTAREIRTQGFEALARLEDQMLVISTMTSQEKVLEFLVYFHGRLSAGQDDGLALPVSRYDIADMLGISPETVCRAFTDLQERGVISLQGPRRISITQRPKE